MKLIDLSSDTLDKIKAVRWDQIIEKHEDPEKWESVFRYSDPEFMMIDGHPILWQIGVEPCSYYN